MIFHVRQHGKSKEEKVDKKNSKCRARVVTDTTPREEERHNNLINPIVYVTN